MKGLNSVKEEFTQFILSSLKICTCSAFLAPLVFSPYAYGGPTGGNVVGGAGNITHSGLTTTITQGSQHLAVDWRSFNLDQNEIVNFLQPDRSSIALNRILDANPSLIQGSIMPMAKLFWPIRMGCFLVRPRQSMLAVCLPPRLALTHRILWQAVLILRHWRIRQV